MEKRKKIIVILAVIIFIVIAVVGFYFYNKNKRTSTPPLATTPIPPKEAKGKLIIKTNPTNAKVIISAISSSFIETRVAPFEIQVPAEKLYVTAYLPYYENSSQEVEIKEGETKTVELTIKHISFDLKEGAPIENKNSQDNSNKLIPGP